MNSEYRTSLDIITKQLQEIREPLRTIQESVQINMPKIKTTAEVIGSAYIKLSNVCSETLKKISISSVIQEYFNRMQEPLQELQKILSEYTFKFVVSEGAVSLLEANYWVIPFEYNYEKLNELATYKTDKEFNNFILDYFNDDRVKRIVAKIKDEFLEGDKKTLIEQIERAYFNKDYAICITSLITLLDGLTLSLITEDSAQQHTSYKAIYSMVEYMGEKPINEFGYILYLKVRILNNFYSKLFKTEITLKNNEKKILSRHLTSHGVVYLNSKIDVLRLLNAICFGQEIISETDMQEQFYKVKKGEDFRVKENDRNIREN